MKYTGSLEDDGVELVCTALQADLYTTSINTRMAVTAAKDPGPAIPIGGIIGIVLGILFLLFLCAALLLLFLCWDKIKYKKKVRKGRIITIYSFLFLKPKQEPVWSRKPSASSEQRKVHSGQIVSETATHEVVIQIREM